ncbi:MAG TPA: ArsA family ATPase, partial [Allocoleopsis sp.]
MTLILTFLGKGGTGRTTIAIATAKKLANQGKKVLLLSDDTSPSLGLLLGTSLSMEITHIERNFDALQLHSTVLLEKGWEEIKQIESDYIRNPVLKNVYGQELSVLPGMDLALSLNAIREYDASGKYDIIIYDGLGNQTTLRMFGMPESLSWYIRRFQTVLQESDLWKTLSTFVQPVTSAVLNVAWTGESLPNQPTNQVNQLLDKGKNAVSDVNRVAAYLVTTGDASAIATAKYLWGSANQVGLTVPGVILNQTLIPDVMAAEVAANLEKLYKTYDQEGDILQTVTAEFAPLTVKSIPIRTGNNWQILSDNLPDFTQVGLVPKPIEIDVQSRQVKLFLPSFDKTQVKLT